MEKAVRADDKKNEELILLERMEKISHKIVVLSGKGGVGKSTVSVNLAVSLAMKGKRVGLLDVDIHGPSIPTMLNIEGAALRAGDNGMLPVEIGDCNNLKVISIGFLLESSDAPVIWRGPAKNGVIKQFLGEVDWGDLDYLVIDCPPGTGDEPLSVIQMIGESTGAIIVTTPQNVSSVDVSRSINFCHKLSLPILGILENMSGFICPGCGKRTDIFRSGGGLRLSEKYKILFLGSVPLDPEIGMSCDTGVPYVQRYASSPVAEIYSSVAETVVIFTDTGGSIPLTQKENHTAHKEASMKIAIPVVNNCLNAHFGHCDEFCFITVNELEKNIISTEKVTPPPHEPGLLPKWLGERGINLVIAGGMGQRAQQLFTERGIKVVTGAPVEVPEKLVHDYLHQTLQTGANSCDH